MSWAYLPEYVACLIFGSLALWVLGTIAAEIYDEFFRGRDE